MSAEFEFAVMETSQGGFGQVDVAAWTGGGIALEEFHGATFVKAIDEGEFADIAGTMDFGTKFICSRGVQLAPVMQKDPLEWILILVNDGAMSRAWD